MPAGPFRDDSYRGRVPSHLHTPSSLLIPWLAPLSLDICLKIIIINNKSGTVREGSINEYYLFQELLRDPLYIGLKHQRVRGKEYDDLLDEFMQAVTDKYVGQAVPFTRVHTLKRYHD